MAVGILRDPHGHRRLADLLRGRERRERRALGGRHAGARARRGGDELRARDPLERRRPDLGDGGDLGNAHARRRDGVVLRHLRLGDADLDAHRHRHAREPDRRAGAAHAHGHEPGADHRRRLVGRRVGLPLRRHLGLHEPEEQRSRSTPRSTCAATCAWRTRPAITSDLVQVRGKVQIKDTASIGTVVGPGRGGPGRPSGCRYPWGGSYVSPCGLVAARVPDELLEHGPRTSRSRP